MSSPTAPGLGSRIGSGGASTMYLAEMSLSAAARHCGRRMSPPHLRAHTPRTEPDLAEDGVRLVAVKVAGSEADSLGQWRSEVIALTKLAHPNIVRYFGCAYGARTRVGGSRAMAGARLRPHGRATLCMG